MILALDLSTKSTGQAIYDETTLVKSGVITASSTDVIIRIRKIISKIKDDILSQQSITDIIAEEVRPETEINVHTHKVLMWLQTSLEFLLHDEFPNIKIEYIYPSSWRKSCGIRTGSSIKRESLKAADIKFVKDTFNLDVNDDEADAIGIGYAKVHTKNAQQRIDWE